ncbi:hypothetical protein F66182_4717 [Fusarium sp. NRRL 66182]|nr:hypothetical protein F66182_4717 [Fusarium sp. NRRL 66182]
MPDRPSPAMFPSPTQSPTPSAVDCSVSEDPLRRSASEPCRRPITPARSRRSAEPTTSTREDSIDQAVEQVPLNLARVIVNMQEYYTSELQIERQRTEKLASQNERMMKKMDDMEKRLQMHVVLMDSFVNFMREVKEGSFTFAASAELEIAKSLGGEHLEQVQSLVADNYSNPQSVQHSVEKPALSEDVLCDGEEEVQETIQFTQQDSSFETRLFDQLPPTPDMDTPPVRSTGRRAPKRRNPPQGPRREMKRRTRPSHLNVRLGDTSSWSPINTRRSAHQSIDSDVDLDEQPGEDNDHDYAPDLGEEEEADEEEAQEEQEPLEAPTSHASSPSLSDPNPRPRYSVPRSMGYRYAAGPPGRRFKYHRMPKTVALVWQEWKHGSNGNPAIEALEKRYNTRWRLGTLQERKYASNYVGVRQKIARKVEEMCEEQELSVEEASIINPTTGQALYHPLEPPQPCEHRNKFHSSACPYHGSCCTPGQIQVCTVQSRGDFCRGWQAYHQIINPAYMYSSGLTAEMQPITDWAGLEKNTDVFAYEEDIRRDFFDIGADMYELARKGEWLVNYLLSGQTYSPEHEASLVREHGQLYAAWSTVYNEMVDMQESWESLTKAGCMEVCPAERLQIHPWRNVFQDCLDVFRGFPMFKGNPFIWLENIEQQDDILRWHPYYHKPRRHNTRVARADRLWRSPAAPRRPTPAAEPEVRRNTQLANPPTAIQRPMPATEPQVPRTVSPATPPASPPAPQGGGHPGIAPNVYHMHGLQYLQDYRSPDEKRRPSGGRIPSWTIPHGEEPDFEWKEIHWGKPADLNASPPMSPNGTPHPPLQAMEKLSIPEKPITFHADALSNHFNHEFEENWSGDDDFMGTEVAAMQEYLHVPAPKAFPIAKPRSLKRRLSHTDVSNEGMKKKQKKWAGQWTKRSCAV